MAKETKNEIKQQTASEIAKDIFNIFDEHIKKTTVYGDGNIMCVKSTVNDISNVVNAISTLFKNKYNVTPRKSLNDYTWQEIKEAADEGYADSVFVIGDTKTITLYTGEKAEVVIVGFNHDTISGSNDKAGITFAFKNLIDGRFEMNETDTTDGGWAKSKMRNAYMQRLFNLLPSDLQDVITDVDKVTGVGGGKNTTETTQDKLFLFSKREIFSDSSNAADFEGYQYPYFEKEENRIAYRAGDTDWWWLRSPYLADSHSFCFVSYDGYASNDWATSGGGVRPAFCL